MTELILLRHGESVWNKMNLFTGWIDVPLSEKGIDEAKEAGIQLDTTNIDVVFSSTLIRAIMTAMITLLHRKDGKTATIMHPQSSLLGELGKIYSEKTIEGILPVFLSDALNERMYGELQGLNKQETMDRFGKEQVQIWRRSFDVAPPNGESLKMTMKRTLPYFHSDIMPYIKNKKNVLIVAHGNSLRSIIKEIESVSDEQIPSYELATGVPIRYKWIGDRFEKQSVHP